MLKTKRELYVLIGILMLFACLMTTKVQAESISKDGYTYIKTAEELDTLLRGNLTGKFRLGSDIDLSAYPHNATTYTNENGWQGIGSQNNPFSGELDGNGYQISGLWIAGRGDNQGLFGWLSGAKVYDLELALGGKGIKECGSQIGTLAGNAYAGTQINNVHVLGAEDTIQCNGDRIGGMIGMVYGSTITRSGVRGMNISGISMVGGFVGGADKLSKISNSYALEMDVTGGGEKAGGFVGAIDGLTNILSCYAVTVHTTAEYAVGGLIGASTNSQIDRSCSYASVKADVEFAGGLIGVIDSTAVLNCYTQSMVTAGKGAGGLVGAAYKGIAESIIQDCYTVSNVVSIDPGAVIARAEVTFKGKNYFSNANLGSSYNRVYKSKQAATPKGTLPYGKSDTYMKRKSTYLYWDYMNIWKIQEKVSYPYFNDYGWWEQNQMPESEGMFTITFDPNGADVTGIMTVQEVEKDEAVELNLNQYNRPGYVFLGWGVSPNGPAVFKEGLKLSWVQDVTLYAVWGRK